MVTAANKQGSSWQRAFWHQLVRDIRLSWRQGGYVLTILSFFVITTALFPLGLGPETDLLARLAPGILWVLALLTCLLSFDRLWQSDYEDGSLEELATGLLSPMMVVLAKMMAHWLGVMVPLIAVAPLMGLLLNLPFDSLGILILALLVGSPALTFIGSMGASLTLGARASGPLLALLVMPLYVPVLIFGTGVIEAAMLNIEGDAHLALLAASSLFAGVVSVPASAAAYKLALE